MKALLKQNILGLGLLLVAMSNINAQKNPIEIEKMFLPDKGWGDVFLKGEGTSRIILDYYVKDGILYKKQDDQLKSLALVAIDFSKASVYENIIDVLVSSTNSPWELDLSTFKPKKNPGLSLTFESKADAELALKYLKMKFENPTKNIPLTTNFSTQLSEITCSASSYFKTIQDETTRRCKIELEGSMYSEISSNSVTIDYGHFDDEASGLKAYNAVREQIKTMTLNCGKIISYPSGDYNPELKAAMGIWVISGVKDLGDKTVTLQATYMLDILTIKVMIVSSNEDDDDW